MLSTNPLKIPSIAYVWWIYLSLLGFLRKKENLLSLSFPDELAKSDLHEFSKTYKRVVI